MKSIRVDAILEHGHSLMNGIVLETAGIIGEAQFVIKIDEALKVRGLSQKDLAQMTGMRVGTISELVNGKGISLNKVQLFAIMTALRITDLTEIIEMRFPDNIKEKFDKQRHEWITDKEMPIEIKEMYRANVLKASGLERH